MFSCFVAACKRARSLRKARAFAPSRRKIASTFSMAELGWLSRVISHGKEKSAERTSRTNPWPPAIPYDRRGLCGFCAARVPRAGSRPPGRAASRTKDVARPATCEPAARELPRTPPSRPQRGERPARDAKPASDDSVRPPPQMIAAPDPPAASWRAQRSLSAGDIIGAPWRWSGVRFANSAFNVRSVQISRAFSFAVENDRLAEVAMSPPSAPSRSVPQ